MSESRIIQENVTVSRKTPLDGRLEVSDAAVARLTSLGDKFVVRLGDVAVAGTVESMACHCARADGAGHVHHFLVSDVTRSLVPGVQVTVALADDMSVEIAREA
jgi:hypothetical protein